MICTLVQIDRRDDERSTSAGCAATIPVPRIDLAGDSGLTAVAVITECETGPRYGFPAADWKKAEGLLRLKELVLGSAGTALDQPFSYPAGMMQLLDDLPTAAGDQDRSAYCSRRTDTAMREFLDTSASPPTI
jgi:hypothetical protein